AIVEQHMPVDYDVVADFQVVAEREFGVLKAFEILAAALEDVASKRPSQQYAEPYVLASGDRAIERVPQPEQWLHPLEARVVELGLDLLQPIPRESENR